MEGKRLIQSLRLKNLLSYGSKGESIQLEPLNVLIGPNASGKSNLIEAISLLKAAPSQMPLDNMIREGGGITEWLWKGESYNPKAEIEAIVDYPEGIESLRYRLVFTSVRQRFQIVDEAIENALPAEPEMAEVYFFYRYQNGHPVLGV